MATIDPVAAKSIQDYIRSQQIASIGNQGFDQIGAYINANSTAGIDGPAPTELATWANQRRQVADQYGNTTANLDFQRSQAQAQQSADTGQLAQTWDRTRNNLPGQFAQKGLLDSGIYGGALQRYGQDRTNASSNLALKYQSQLGGYGLQQQQAQSAYTSGTQQIDSSEAARRQDLASQLKGVV